MRHLLKTLSQFIWFLFFITFISWYIETWFGALKKGNIFLFIVMSILPAWCVWTVWEEATKPNVYGDMMDAQIKAWQRENALAR